MDIYVLGGLHGSIFLFVAAAIIYVDHQGYLYFRGKKELLSKQFITWSHRLIWIGLLLMVSTGAILASSAIEYYIQQLEFQLKMAFVLVLVINAFAIGSLSKLAATVPFAQLSRRQQHTLMLSGALSFMGWVGAASIGFFIL